MSNHTIDRIWIIYTEIGPSHDYPNGAVVECYVPTQDISDALTAARQQFLEDGYSVVDISRCIPFESEEWDAENDPEGEVREAVSRAIATSKTQFGVFRTWEK